MFDLLWTGLAAMHGEYFCFPNRSGHTGLNVMSEIQNS